MRFIFNFFFFGLLFYLIYLFFPEAFTTLVSWANQVVAFLKETFQSLYDRFGHTTKPADKEHEHTTQALLYISNWIM